MNIEFQFHKGAIKTHSSAMSSIVISLFQFHKGAIKTRTQTIDLPILRFQFHKGAIKTDVEKSVSADTLISIP